MAALCPFELHAGKHAGTVLSRAEAVRLPYYPVQKITEVFQVKSFPAFLKNEEDKVDSSQQYTEDIEGYYFSGKSDVQLAFWEYSADRESGSHAHEFDEYVVCVCGEYTTIMDGREVILKPGNELVIPRGTAHSSKAKAGTRAIFGFSGKRIKQ